MGVSIRPPVSSFSRLSGADRVKCMRSQCDRDFEELLQPSRFSLILLRQLPTVSYSAGDVGVVVLYFQSGTVGVLSNGLSFRISVSPQHTVQQRSDTDTCIRLHQT